jgi:uncharacterized C2H2 Zn-finger protein
MFKKKNCYEEHMTSHNGPSLYNCERCGKMFVARKKLEKHQKVHELKSYVCPDENCLKEFDKRALMVKHKHLEHKLGRLSKVLDRVRDRRDNGY